MKLDQDHRIEKRKMRKISGSLMVLLSMIFGFANLNLVYAAGPYVKGSCDTPGSAQTGRRGHILNIQARQIRLGDKHLIFKM